MVITIFRQRDTANERESEREVRKPVILILYLLSPCFILFYLQPNVGFFVGMYCCRLAMHLSGGQLPLNFVAKE